MIYKIAICDDSKEDTGYVAGLLKKWSAQRQMAVQAECFPSAESFLFQYAEDKNYDILLLDIEMGQMDGVTMARQIRRDNETVQIVFYSSWKVGSPFSSTVPT